MSPSLAMAYNTRGSGNMAPRREVESPNSAPTPTTRPAQGMCASRKAAGSGAEASWRKSSIICRKFEEKSATWELSTPSESP